MRKKVLLVFILLLSSIACIAQSNIVSRISIYDNPDYSKPLIALKELIKQKSKNKTNTFYISKVHNFSDNSNYAWVYWKEKNALILWEPLQMGSENRKHELTWSRRFLIFGKKIVPPKRFYQGSNFLILMKEGLALKRECLKGYKFVVSKTVRKKRKS